MTEVNINLSMDKVLKCPRRYQKMESKNSTKESSERASSSSETATPSWNAAMSLEDMKSLSDKNKSTPIPEKSKVDTPTGSSTDTQTINAKKEFIDLLDEFLEFCGNIVNFRANDEIKLQSAKPQISPIKTGVEKYRLVFKETQSSPKHVEKFAEVYKSCRSKLSINVSNTEESTHEFMDWFSTKTFTVSPTEKSKATLFLCILFKKCISIADRVSEMAEKEQDVDAKEKIMSDPATIYPEIFMIHLLRVFVQCAPVEDAEEFIIPRIRYLESSNSIVEDANPDSQTDINDWIGTVAGLAKDIGVEMPSAMNGKSRSEMQKAFNYVSKNPETKDMLRETFKGIDLKDPTKIKQSFAKIMERMQENSEKIPEPVQRSLNATVENPTGNANGAGSSKTN